VTILCSFNSYANWFVSNVFFLGSELWASRCPWWKHEDSKWSYPWRECEVGKGQIQNLTANTTRKHQTAHWWIWVHVNSLLHVSHVCSQYLCMIICCIVFSTAVFVSKSVAGILKWSYSFDVNEKKNYMK